MLNVSAITLLSLSKRTARRCFRSSTYNNINFIAAGRKQQPQSQLIAVVTCHTRTFAATSQPVHPFIQKTTADELSSSTRRRRYNEKTWFADSRYYPLFFVMGTSLLATAARLIFGSLNDDVQSDPTRRGSVVRYPTKKELDIILSQRETQRK